jgi:hypothetical protein
MRMKSENMHRITLQEECLPEIHVVYVATLLNTSTSIDRAV